MLDWLKQNANKARDTMKTEIGKYKNREFMEAVVAGCAMVSAADGDISSAEKQKMIGFMEHSDELKVFSTEEVIRFFKKTCDSFEFDAAIGQAEAMKVVGKLKGKDEAARLMIRVCCAIGASDGTFDEKEQAVVRRICNELGQDPSLFDL